MGKTCSAGGKSRQHEAQVIDLDCYVPGPCNIRIGPLPAKPKLTESKDRGAGARVLDLARLSFLCIRSLRLHFPPGRSEQAAATNGCVTLRREQRKAPREASRSFLRCKVSINFMSPSQSLSWLEVWTFSVLFLFVYFYAKSSELSNQCALTEV